MKKKSFIAAPREGDGIDPAERIILSVPKRQDDAAAQQAQSPSASSQAHLSGGLLALAHPKPETKSKRVQLLIKPSLFNNSKAAAESANISFNEIVSIALERLLESLKK